MPLKLKNDFLDEFYQNLDLIPSIEGKLMHWIQGHLDSELPAPIQNTMLRYNGIELYVRKRKGNE